MEKRERSIAIEDIKETIQYSVLTHEKTAD